MHLMCINRSIPTSHDYTCVQLTMQLCNFDIFNFRVVSRKTVIIPQPAVHHSPSTRPFKAFYVPFLFSSTLFQPFHPVIFPCRNHICLKVYLRSSTLKIFPFVLLPAHFPSQAAITISCCGNGNSFFREIPR